ncbi:MAG: M12 family metallo-peptidase [Saprospiraceae bacterium]
MRYTLAFIAAVLLFGTADAQGIWKNVDRFPSSDRKEAAITFLPSAFASFELDWENLSRQSSLAPFERAGQGTTSIELPFPDGSTQKFEMVNSPVMEAGLAQKFPSIQSYKAWTSDKKYVARFDVSAAGFHASIRGPEGEIYIDPFYKNDNTSYIAYYVHDHTEPMDLIPGCGADHTEESPRPGGHAVDLRTSLVNLHEFKLALACTGEWGKVRGTVELCLADMVTSVNRINQIYENEFASRLILINDNDKLIQLDPNTDPYTKSNEGRSLLTQNTEVINNILGNSNLYDLGHVYTLSCTDVGGVAFLTSLCSPNKGAGVTCHYTSLLVITVQVTSHEMGHQLGAQHTFNNCGDNESFDNGFEPGSGSTIMSYGGLCGQQNVQGNNDDYYHNASLIQIYDHSRFETGGAYGCSDKVATGNHLPEVFIDFKEGMYIPTGTPFVLDGHGQDEDNDAMTFCWEEKDAAGARCDLGSPTGSCPTFRTFRPTQNPYRIFPSPAKIFANQASPTEVLPTYTRDLNFALTVRDNNPQGGMAVWKETKLLVDGNSGPFQVVSPNLGEQYKAGEVINVIWNVNNTDKAPVNCKYVDIYLSKANAIHVSDPNLTLLAGRVPNTGSALVQMPNITGSDIRIMIKAQDNVFFDISNYRFSINPATDPTAYYKVNKYYEKLCLPATTTLQVESDAIAGYTGQLTFGVASKPEGVNFKPAKAAITAGDVNTIDIEIPNSVNSGNYNIVYYAITDNNDTLWRNLEIEVTSTDFTSLASLTPENGEKDAELPTFTWKKSFNATGYVIEVSKDPTFASKEFSVETADTFYKHFKTFDKKSVYYWRVQAFNGCMAGSWTALKVFGTLVADCKNYVATGLPLNISASGVPTIQSKINVPTGKNISDVNVSKLKINHNNFKDLTGTLISPAGTKVILWESICEKQLNIEVLIDDQAPAPFSCANTASGQYRPKEKLETLNGQDATGVWTLEIKDTKAGNGGKLDGFEMEICASVTVENPYQVNDVLLEMTPVEVPTISRNYLAVEDKNNSAEQLTYVVVSLPAYGNLLLNNNVLAVGSQFTQADINSGKLSYAYTSAGNNLPLDENFHYLVQDPEGGWLGINQFNIRINAITATQETEELKGLDLYPNPASQQVHVVLDESLTSFSKYKVSTITGIKVLEGSIIGLNAAIDISQMAPGIYLFTVTNGQKILSRKLFIQQ